MTLKEHCNDVKGEGIGSEVLNKVDKKNGVPDYVYFRSPQASEPSTEAT